MAQTGPKIQWIPKAEVDYSYIENFRRAYNSSTDPNFKNQLLDAIESTQGGKEYHTGSMKQIDHLVQIGSPNRDINEARWDLYKVTVTFLPLYVISEVRELRNSNHRVLF